MIGLSRCPPWAAPLHTAQRTNQVEILKFSEPPKRSSRTKTQKRGGVMPLLAVAVSVAVIGGMSTTLAGTITLNSSGNVEFGQGVVTTAACDTSVSVTPTSAFKASNSTFSVSSVTISNVGTVAGGADGAGCLGKKFTLKAYDASNTLLTVDSGTAFSEVFVTIPTDSATAAAGTFTKTAWVGVTVPNTGSGWDNSGSAGWTSATSGTGTLTITGLEIPGSVTRITVESSS